MGPAPAEEAGDIVLGAPTSLTTVEGTESLMAARLAVEEINRAGGVLIGSQRRRLKLEAVDLKEVKTAAPPGRAVARLREFILEKKPRALVIGPFRSEVLLASMDLLAEHKIPTVSCIAMSPAVDAKILSDPKYKFIFRVGLNNKYLATYLIETMKLLKRKFGFDRVFILNQDVAWARSTAYLMIKLYFNRKGWRVLGQENLAEGAADFKAALGRARERRAQVLLAIFDTPSSRALVEQWHEQGSRAALCGFISPVSGPGAWADFQGNLAGVMNVIFELGNIPSAKYRPATDFYRAFQARYGHAIQAGHGPAPAYESVRILAEAMERAGSLDPDRVAAALEATDRQGAMGRVRFHRGHQAVFGQDPQSEALSCVVQWSGKGERKIVHPQALAEEEIKLPRAGKPGG
ncbi:hypothetical protein AAU61_06550 [Desulfocarbo indianensis]|nr:hypothetical protein AAU61_06550 [Desulfocarbo indianensis]